MEYNSNIICLYLRKLSESDILYIYSKEKSKWNYTSEHLLVVREKMYFDQINKQMLYHRL